MIAHKFLTTDFNEQLYEKLCTLNRGKDFRIALDKALKEGFPIDYLSPKWNCYSTFLCWVIKGSIWKTGDELKDYYDTIRFMLDRRADVNADNKNGWNALMYVCDYAGKHCPQDLFARIVSTTNNLEQISAFDSECKKMSLTDDTALAKLVRSRFKSEFL